MKQYNISNKHKEQVYRVVLKLPKKTNLQKARFIRYYGLQPTEFKKKHYQQFQKIKIVLQML